VDYSKDVVVSRWDNFACFFQNMIIISRYSVEPDSPERSHSITPLPLRQNLAWLPHLCIRRLRGCP
jgi:hypothetical protein